MPIMAKLKCQYQPRDLPLKGWFYGVERQREEGGGEQQGMFSCNACHQQQKTHNYRFRDAEFHGLHYNKHDRQATQYSVVLSRLSNNSEYSTSRAFQVKPPLTDLHTRYAVHADFLLDNNLLELERYNFFFKSVITISS